MTMYREPVGRFGVKVLPEMLRAAIDWLSEKFPGLGVTLFVFDIGQGGGMSYISNAQREGMVAAIDEFLERQRGPAPQVTVHSTDRPNRRSYRCPACMTQTFLEIRSPVPEWGVTQTITGDDGNCLEAAIATVIGLQCADFPLDLVGHPESHPNWTSRLMAWLAERDWIMGEAFPNDPPAGLHVAVGPSPRKPGSHAVVALNGVPIFDPHPTRAFFGDQPIKYFITLDRDRDLNFPNRHDGKIG